MLTTDDLNAKITSILASLDTIKALVDSLIAGALIPDSVGVALDVVQSAINNLQSSLEPPTPIT